MATPSEASTFPSPADSAMSPYFTELATPASLTSEPAVKKVSHSRRRPPGHIPRPRNAFILFRSHYVAAQLIPGKVENDHRHISKIIGEIWNSLPPPERLVWEQRADVEKEKHSRMYPGYRYKPAKLEGVVKRRVKCRGIPVLASAYSSTPGIGVTANNDTGPRELVGSLTANKGGNLHFIDSKKARFINQEERRKDRARCARVAALVQQGVVGEQLEQEAQRQGLDRESAMAAASPHLEPSPGIRGHFHTNVDVLRALGEASPVFTNPFAPANPEIPQVEDTPTPAFSPPSVADTPLNEYTVTPTPSYMSPVSPVSEHPEGHTHKGEMVESDAEKAHRGWPHRRASSLPLPPPPTPPVYHEFNAPSRFTVVEPEQSESTPAPVLTVSLPRRPSSSSPMRRHRHFYSPYPLPTRKEPPPQSPIVQMPQETSKLDVAPFDHISYQSPANSPPTFFYSPGTYPHLQLVYPPTKDSSGSGVSLPSPLYGIDAVRRGGRRREPIDLSAMYNEQDGLTEHDSTLHSTYATHAGKAYTPVPASPASASSTHAGHESLLPMPMQGHESLLSAQGQELVHDQTPSPTLGLGLHPGPAYTYNWHGHEPYSADNGHGPYTPDTGHGSYTPDSGPDSYTPNAGHDSYTPDGGYSQVPSPQYASSGLGQYEGGHQMYYAPGMGGPTY
ncbi:hypothetical protein BDV93DRAFT_610236 [Ceratobasidium sp. AG-I]|nr:hypothetical protein BDV93DRAFT_610236 [Ceratobasidium sp. AG-I]